MAQKFRAEAGLLVPNSVLRVFRFGHGQACLSGLCCRICPGRVPR